MEILVSYELSNNVKNFAETGGLGVLSKSHLTILRVSERVATWSMYRTLAAFSLHGNDPHADNFSFSSSSTLTQDCDYHHTNLGTIFRGN